MSALPRRLDRDVVWRAGLRTVQHGSADRRRIIGIRAFCGAEATALAGIVRHSAGLFRGILDGGVVSEEGVEMGLAVLAGHSITPVGNRAPVGPKGFRARL